MESCRGGSSNAHYDVFVVEGEEFCLSRPQEIPGSGRSTPLSDIAGVGGGGGTV